MERHGSSMLMELAPLVVVGGAFLVGLGVVHRERSAGADRSGEVRRWPTIALLFTASMAHVPVIPSHLREAPYMGVLFICFTCAAFILAAVLAARPVPVLYAISGILCAAAVLAYAATRIVAFPQLGDDVGNWTEPLGLVSVAAELGVVLISAFTARHSVVPVGGSTPEPPEPNGADVVSNV